MRMLYLDVANGDVKTVDIDANLHTYYELLNCDCIEMPERRIGFVDKYFTIICDESGWLRENPIPSALDNFGNIKLVGNLLFCNMNYETGCEEELSQDEVEYIKRFIEPVEVMNRRTGETKTLFMLTQCAY